MTTRKLNEFLDAGFSDGEDDSDRGYDSEAAEESKGRSKKSLNKRRKLSDDEDEDSGSEDGAEIAAVADERFKIDDMSEADDDNDAEDAEQSTITTSTSKSKTAKAPSAAALKKSAEKAASKTRKSGVVYLSSLPPYLKPSSLKSLLIARGFGPINRVFLTPSTHGSSTTAAKNAPKSNKRRQYADGWIEFESKKTAKICAETLNAQIVGGKKGGWYHDDIWNMRYLRNFKWDDLMEQMQRERSEREARGRIEDARAARENRSFVEGLERGRVVEGIQKTRKEKEERRLAKGEAVEGSSEKKEKKKDAPAPIARTFRQVEVKGKKEKKKASNSDGVDAKTKSVLGKIF